MFLSTKYAKVSPRNTKKLLQPIDVKPLFIVTSSDTTSKVKGVNAVKGSIEEIKLTRQLSSESRLLSYNPHENKLKYFSPPVCKPEIKEESPKFTEQKLGTVPPYIRKLERFLAKIGTISNKNIGYSSPEVFMGRREMGKSRANTMKSKPTGIPARYKEVPNKKSALTKDIKKESTQIKRDLDLIRVNDGINLKERLEIAKVARVYEENNKNGIVKNKLVEDSWRWYTPGNTPTNKSVHFDIKD